MQQGYNDKKGLVLRYIHIVQIYTYIIYICIHSDIYVQQEYNDKTGLVLEDELGDSAVSVVQVCRSQSPTLCMYTCIYVYVCLYIHIFYTYTYILYIFICIYIYSAHLHQTHIHLYTCIHT